MPALESLPKQRRLNDLFYWDCVVFQVEDELFSVPRREFVDSSDVFAAMLSAPTGNHIVEGRDQDHPIYLEGYLVKDFVALLRVMYPKYQLQVPSESPKGAPQGPSMRSFHLQFEEWKSVLKLATIWVMDKYRDYAIYRLSTDYNLSPYDKIVLAREHCISTWFFEGISALADVTAEPIPIEELAVLGWETAARISSLYAHQLGGRCGRLSLGSIKCTKLAVGSLGRECGNALLPIAGATCRACKFEMDEASELACAAAVAKSARLALGTLLCPKCRAKLFPTTMLFRCGLCCGTHSVYDSVRTDAPRMASIEEMISEFFQAEMDHYAFTSISII